MKKIVAVTIAVLLAACGSGLDGTYRDEIGLSTYTFKSGKVIVSTLGMQSEMDYKVEDDKLKIISPQGTTVMNIHKDGLIEGPMGLKLIKQKD